MITIGIDPGIEKVGVGIIEKQNNNKLNLLFYKLIKTSSKLPHEDRLQIIYHELLNIISMYPINFASIEKLYFAKNIKTAMLVSEARGVMMLALKEKNIPIYEYTPLQIKQSLVGYGKASKAQIQEFIKIMLNLKKIPKPDDVADGIALAIIHFNFYKTFSKINRRII